MSKIIDILNRCDIEFNPPDENNPDLIGLDVISESQDDVDFFMRYAVSGKIKDSGWEYPRWDGEIFIARSTLDEWGIRLLLEEKYSTYAGWETIE